MDIFNNKKINSEMNLKDMMRQNRVKFKELIFV